MERPSPAPDSGLSSSFNKVVAPSARTLNELYFGAVDRFGHRPLTARAKRNGRWMELSYHELTERVRDVSLGLLELGLAPGDRVAILSENRPEWAIADYACLTARCTDVPIYPTLPPKQVEYCLCDSGAVAVFVSTRHQLDKLHSIRTRVPALRHIIAFEDDAVGMDVKSVGQVIALGRASRVRHPRWKDDALAVQPDDLATLIYTSGTTGEMKGVMLTHGNIAFYVSTCCQLFTFSQNYECLSFLPLS